jgi:hypothetical protein
MTASYPDLPEDPVLEGARVLEGYAVEDEPEMLPLPSESYENFVERVNSPDKPHDRFWVARRGDRPVAMSFLRFPPVLGDPDRLHVQRSRVPRARSRARRQAPDPGASVQARRFRVLTGNDSENAAMLHINETLGYDRRPGFVSLIKRVET